MTSPVLADNAFHTTTIAAPKEVSTTPRPQVRVMEGIPGKHLIGIVFAASALVGGGWFFWTLARALETYHVY